MEKRPIKALIVEDDPLFLGLLRQMLARVPFAAFDLAWCDRLGIASQHLRSQHFDVVLLDLTLPDSHGLQTFTQMHAQAPALPIIILTGVEDDETQALEAVREGAQDYLIKGEIEGKMLARIMRYAIERKQIEQALREREEFFRLISENVTDLIAVLDRTGKRLYNSPSYKNLFGDPGTMRGTDSFVEIHPEDQEKVKRIFQETVATGIGQRTEYRFVSDDGSVRYVESVGSVIKDETGQTNKVVVVSRDMTEHRQAVERLRQSETLYHSLVESLPQNIFRKDLAGRFTFGNQRFCQAVRAPLEQILGKTDFDFYPAELAEKYQEDDRTVLKTGEIFETVEANQPLGGERIDVHVVKIPIYDAQGQITGIQGIYWDITKQKQAEEALLKTLADLKKSHEDLKAAQMQLIQAAKLESVGTLAAGVAHEVKNPLQTILMGLDFLTRNCPVHEATLGMVLADMRSAVKRADSIVRGLLHFSAAHQPDAKDEDLNAVMAQSLLLARYELTKSRIVLRGDLAPDLPRVRLDKAKMEQVFINLFMNAIHAMPQGGTLTVRTWSKRLARSEELDERSAGNLKVGDTVVIAAVEDTGTGIPEENLAKIFDPFFTTKPTGVGTGLGLPVTKKIIELHGGTIDIKNAPAGGVQVTITLKAQSTDQQ